MVVEEEEGALLSLHMTNLLTVRWKQSLFTYSKNTVLGSSAQFGGDKPYVDSAPLARVAKRRVGTVNKSQRFLFRLLKFKWFRKWNRRAI